VIWFLQLEDENERLQRQNSIYGKVLAVRDAMLQTFTLLNPTSLDPQHEAGAPVRVATQGLAHAIYELPSEGEMDAAAGGQASPEQQQQAQQQQQRQIEQTQQQQPQLLAAVMQKAQQQQLQLPQQQLAPQQQGGEQAAAERQGSAAEPALRAAASSGSVTSGVGAGVQRVTWNLAEPFRRGVAGQLDGSALASVGTIPAAPHSVRERVLAMTEPEHLVGAGREGWAAGTAAGPAVSVLGSVRQWPLADCGNACLTDGAELALTLFLAA
jgi:hypothetical protein